MSAASAGSSILGEEWVNAPQTVAAAQIGVDERTDKIAVDVAISVAAAVDSVAAAAVGSSHCPV